MKRSILWILGLMLVAIVAYSIYLCVPRYDYFTERVGALANAEVIEEKRPGDLGYSVSNSSAMSAMCYVVIENNIFETSWNPPLSNCTCKIMITESPLQDYLILSCSD